MDDFEPYKFNYKWINETNKTDLINLRKNLSKMFDMEEDKNKVCLICGKQIGGYCDSHSIPQFVLKKISSSFYDGKSFLMNGLVDPSGLKKTLIFKNICRPCDSLYFQKYENDSWMKYPATDEIMNLIATKNLLHYIYKKKKEIYEIHQTNSFFIKKLNEIPYESQYADLVSELFFTIEHGKNRLKYSEIDLKEYEDELKKREKMHYKIIFEKKLSYKTEMACQAMINLVSDLNGKLINDIYDDNSLHKMEKLHICIFPTDDGTEVLLFTDINNMKYDNLKKQLSHHDADWTFIINYMILLYCEDWAISSNFKADKETIEKLKDVVAISQDLPINTSEHKIRIKKACDIFKLKVNRKIYNFLANQNPKI